MAYPSKKHTVPGEAQAGKAPPPGKAGAGQHPASVTRSHLVNRLNYLNFQDQAVLVGLRHLTYDNSITLRAKPLPCAGERLDLSWAEASSLRQLLRNYRFEYLLIPDGKKYLLVNPEILQLDEGGISCLLPVSCHEFQLRKIRRHQVSGVSIQLSQHGALFQGEVLDFTPVTLRAQVVADPPETFYWINPETPINLRLCAGGRLLYSGPSEILWQSALRATRTVVLGGMKQNIQRFKGKRYRNSRQQLVPSPCLVFEHPLIGRRINLKVSELSGAGFSVEENTEDSVLMPGMIIPDLKLSFAQGLSLRCQAQVVFRNPTGEGEPGSVRCGLAILDMDIRDHVKLLSLLHQVANRNSYVGTEVDLDELWNFFFETGFIYPAKYSHFQAHKEKIKRTYRRLYGLNPQIARHFIYQERGAILGHMAMVRFYRNSWMIHHHAARKSLSLRAGVAVLEQIADYLNELGNFYFAHLRYVYCYYRPDNRFPSRVFGGFAEKGRDPKVCSLDDFAYGTFRASTETDAGLPEGWEFSPSTPFDHSELASFYGFASGGLLVDAFDLRPGSDSGAELAREYASAGFRKETYCYSLRREGSLKAFVLANCTDAGLNMAELTNCVTLFVLDEELPGDLARLALTRASRHYEGGELPVLCYPPSYAEAEGLPREKVYRLWILDLQYTDDYFAYCDRLFGRRNAGQGGS